MNNRVEDRYFAEEAPLLAGIPKHQVFTTPEGYFENLERQINRNVLLESLRGQTPFELPEAYFSQLEAQLVARTKLETTLSGTNEGFSVPPAYFATAQNRILQKTTGLQDAKILRFNFAKYAAAACILLTTFAGGYFNVAHNTSVTYQLSKVPAKEIERYLTQHPENIDVPMLLENIDEDFDFDFTTPEVETLN